MHRIVWLLVGLVFGFVLAHFANRTPSGQRLLSTIDRGAREFKSAVAQGYHSREAEFASTIHDVESAISSLNKN
jgi:hypothetical protein